MVESSLLCYSEACKLEIMPDILIVEDDKFLSKIYLTKFNKIGLETEIAYDGEEGLEKMRAEKPKLILLDLIMPKMDGFEVLETMNADPELKKIPVLVLSNLGQEADVQRAKKLGAKKFIVKSDTSIQEVVALVKEHIK